ncbi:MAG: hypothetical protein JW713_07405, partial [Pontiellaceae bacterium]|nr:hypothetical protein [Pontiellaceae bacterium]
STWQTASWANSEAFIRGCLDDGIKFPVGMCLQDAGWNGGPWLGGAVRNFYQPTEYVVWTDYIEHIKDRVAATDWELSQEDIKPGLVWGAQVLQKLAQEVRVAENRMIMAEKAAAFNAVFNGSEWPDAGFSEAWRTLMLAQHHDCWIVPYNGAQGDTWADKVTRWTEASNGFAEREVEKLFLDFSSGSGTRGVRVFNTLGCSRTDRVTLALPEESVGAVGVYTLDGERLESQWIASGGDSPKLCFEATVPGVGFASFLLKREKAPARQPSTTVLPNGDLQVETDFYSVTFDSEHGGTIRALSAKKQGGRSLVGSGKLLNDLRGFFYDEGRFIQLSDSRAELAVLEDGPLLVRVQISGRLDKHRVRQVVDIPKTQPRIDFSLQIEWEGQPGIGEYDQRDTYRAEDLKKAFYNDEYKLHLCFPLNGMDGTLFKNAPFEVCASRLEDTLYSGWDEIKHNVILNWVDVQNEAEQAGVALFIDHTTSYLQTDGLPLGLTVQYVGKGLWARDYRIHGPTRIRYALLPHSGTWEDAGVAAASDAWNEPLIARPVNEDTDTAQSRSLLEVRHPGLELTSAVFSDDALVARFFKVSSSGGPQEIRWGFPVKKVELVDLNGKPLEEMPLRISSDGGAVTRLSMPQFGFRTLKVTKAGSDERTFQ